MDLPKNKILSKFLFVLLFAALLFLTFNRHSKSTYSDYHSVIWSDKAGYYVFLPALFIYHFSASEFDPEIGKKTGDGFSLDEYAGKVFSKYTYGVALLQLPFFLAAHLVTSLFDFPSDGFSPIYHWSIMVASVFYSVLGLFFLNIFLKNYFTKYTRILLLFFVVTATNFYYYAVDEVGMSHIYSFSFFSIFLYFLKTLLDGKFQSKRLIFLLSILSAIIILIRPTNFIFIMFCLFLDAKNLWVVCDRVKKMFGNFRIVLTFFLGYAIVFLPQLLYWHYLNGSLLHYSYHGESFSNWASPRFAEIWFSTNNGLFTYSPFLLLIFPGLYLMLREKNRNSISIAMLFFLISYVFASWWSWNFGCAFGNRCFVEYYSILCIPIGYFFQNILLAKKKWGFALTHIAGIKAKIPANKAFVFFGQ